MERPEHKLPRPPQARVRLEFPAVVEPALRDIPEYEGPVVEGEAQRFESGRHGSVARESFLSAAHAVAFADDRVQRLLGGRRHTIIGVSRRDDDKERREPLSVLVAYRYEDARAIEVWLSGEGDQLRVADVHELDYQPPPSDAEIERAIDIARHGRGVAEQWADGFEATALLTSDVELGDRHYGRRIFFVGFGPADERQPRVRVLVDLDTERVVAVETARGERDDEERAR